MVDRYGRVVEVITLSRGYGPQQWIRGSVRGILFGPGDRYEPAVTAQNVDAAGEIGVHFASPAYPGVGA
jgi:hypothetical protein